MKVYIGAETIGDTAGEGIGGLSGSTESNVQTAAGSTRARLADRGSPVVNLQVPQLREFDTVDECERWLAKFTKAGRFSGVGILETAGGYRESFNMAVATMASFSQTGVSVRIVWNVRMGDKIQ